MNLTVKSLLKFLAWPVGIALLLTLYFADNIKGYYRFKELCVAQAGLKVYQPLERNVGWLVDGGRLYDTQYIDSFEAVAFVRYRNAEDGKWYDVYRAPKINDGRDGYAQQPADLSKPVVYKSRVINIYDLPNEVRMGSQIMEFIDLRTNKLAASYTELGYSKFNREKTLLAAPSGEVCPDQFWMIDPKTGKQTPSHQELAISSMFNQ